MKQVMLILTNNKEVGMKSMNRNVRGFSKGIAALLFAAAVSAVPTHAGVVAGGTVPVINTVRAIGNTSIDLSADGADANLVAFWVDNNTPGGFVLDVIMTKGGFAAVGAADALTASGGVPFTAVDVVENTVSNTATGGALGATAAAWADLAQATPAAAATMTAPYTSGPQTSATVDYGLMITGDWTADTDLLAGYYTETFTISLVAVF
jgi:hypothetical protein